MLLSALLPSWKLAARRRERIPRTILSYLDAVKRLEAYLSAELPLDPPAR